MNFENVRKRLNEKSIARQVLRFEILPDMALPIYEKDPDTTAYIMGEEGENVLAVSKPKRVIFPLFTLDAADHFTDDEVVEYFAKAEMERLMAILDAAVVHGSLGDSDYEASEVNASKFSMQILADAFKKVERHSLHVSNILISQDDIDYISNAVSDMGTLTNDPDAEGEVGQVMGATVYASETVPSGFCYVLTADEFLGSMPIRTHVAKNLKQGGTFESLAMGVWNPRGICRIKF